MGRRRDKQAASGRSASAVIWRRVLQFGVVVLALLLLFEGLRSLAPSGSGPGADFSGVTLKGQKWSLAEHRGKNPIVVNFFATWCGPCRLEYPHLLELEKKHAAKGLQVVLLSNEPEADVRQFPEFVNSPLKIIPDSASVFEAYGVGPIPHTVIFNREGKVVQEIQGYDETLVELVEKNL
jgi:thiol-disulfide isomerase/thioredoxin